MITKRKLQFFSSEIEPNECNIRKKIHLEEENKILIKFHKNINITNLDEKVNFYLIFNECIFSPSWNK